MTDHEAAWRAHQRARWMQPDADRWMRPDAERWIRPDAARFLKPGTDVADVFPALAKKYRPDQPRIQAGQFGGGRWTDDWGGAPSTFRDLMPPKTVPTTAELPKKPTSAAAASLADLIKPIPAATSDDLARNLRQVGGGNAGRRVGISASDAFPGTTARQLWLLDRAMERSSNALAQIRQYDPEWKPSEPSLTRPGSIEGAIAEAEARARESEVRLDQLRSGIGGNLGPPLESSRQSLPSMRPFDGQGWINVYRTIYNAPNLFGEPAWRPETGTVAAAEIDGKLYFGVNRLAPGYTSSDYSDANQRRWNLINDYPGTMETDNIGQAPNNSLYHAEATILLRAARDNGGSLASKSITVEVDREVCWSCGKVLPLLGIELGNPTVTYIERPTGITSIMTNGKWLILRSK